VSISLHKFYSDGVVRARNSQERYCQAMFNHLAIVRPDLSEVIRGTDIDPFYCSAPVGEKWDGFVQFIETNWYPSEGAKKEA